VVSQLQRLNRLLDSSKRSLIDDVTVTTISQEAADARLPEAARTPSVQFTTALPPRTNARPFDDYMETGGRPADQNRNTNQFPTLLQPRQGKVPRTTDLAAEFADADNANLAKTTIMIRNIPNRYTQRELVLELEGMGFGDSFDFVYLPMDKSTRASLGYAFVNFINATWADKCMTDFQDYRFKRHRNFSSKIAVATVAHLQGLEKNLAHYEGKFVNSSKRKKNRPLVVHTLNTAGATHQTPSFA
jgi:hypothetical protein